MTMRGPNARKEFQKNYNRSDLQSGRAAGLLLWSISHRILHQKLPPNYRLVVGISKWEVKSRLTHRLTHSESCRGVWSEKHQRRAKDSNLQAPKARRISSVTPQRTTSPATTRYSPAQQHHPSRFSTSGRQHPPESVSRLTHPLTHLHAHVARETCG